MEGKGSDAINSLSVTQHSSLNVLPLQSTKLEYKSDAPLINENYLLGFVLSPHLNRTCSYLLFAFHLKYLR